jgi:invasion protein IalB
LTCLQIIMRALYLTASIISLCVASSATAGEGSLWPSDWLFGDKTASPPVIAQAKQAAPPKTTPAPQQGSDGPPAERTETTNFDNWILSCREFVDGPKKRTCAMTVAVRKSDTNRTVLSWTVRQNDKGQMVSIIETLPGISITPGIELKPEKAATSHKVPIEICEPNWCSGSLPMDKALIQELATSSKATVVITSSAGQPFTFEFPINGFEKAFAKM